MKGVKNLENSMSRILIETVVRKTIKELKRDPERSVRKLVDMALNFSGGRFQKDFFEIAQKMLENEDSPYYTLLRDLVSYVDPERLFCFGMNLGYNSCTYGAQQIRNHEKQWNFNIPWIIALQMNQKSLECVSEYQKVISDGESLGVYSWLLSAKTAAEELLPLIDAHPESAFFLFCEPQDITDIFLNDIRDINNVMLVIHYEENTGETYAKIREEGIPYSVFYMYNESDSEILENGDLFYTLQQYYPVFTILEPEPGCSGSVQKLAGREASIARNGQLYHTFPFELYSDNHAIDKIISDDACTVMFDSDGNLLRPEMNRTASSFNLFRDGLRDILRTEYAKIPFAEEKRA